MQEAQSDTEGAILSRRSSKFSVPGHRERAWVFVMYSPCLLKSVWVGFDGRVLKSGGFTFFSLAVRYCTGSDEWVITGRATMAFPISRSFFAKREFVLQFCLVFLLLLHSGSVMMVGSDCLLHIWQLEGGPTWGPGAFACCGLTGLWILLHPEWGIRFVVTS